MSRTTMIENVLHGILEKHIDEGTLVLTYPSGRTERYGNGEGRPVALRIEDTAALRAIALDPGLKVAEMYMDGRAVLTTGLFCLLFASSGSAASGWTCPTRSTKCEKSQRPANAHVWGISSPDYRNHAGW